MCLVNYFYYMEKETNSEQHVEVPHWNKDDTDISPSDQLVYACIRRYMDKDTKESGVSMDKISKLCGASKPTIIKCINNLKNCDYFTITKKPNKFNGKMMNYYKINTKKGKHFEEFTIDFLEKEDLPFLQKAYLLAAQQYMFKDREPGIGIIEMSDKELGQGINVSEKSVKRYNKALEKTKYLTIIENNIKKFDLDSLGQALVCTAINHEDRITTNEERIEALEKELLELKNNYTLIPKEKPTIIID